MTFHNAHLTLHAFVGAGTHDAILCPPTPPAPPPPKLPITPHLSMDTLIGLNIKAKWSATEVAMGINLVARGNDSQYVVPHLCIPPAPVNLLLPLVIAMGGSKVMFGSSTVKINAGGAQDCGACVPPCIPTSLNLACNNPCNYPSDQVIAPNTVEVMMTLGDIIGGIFSTLVDIAVSFAVGKIAGGINSRVIGAAARAFHPGAKSAAQRAFFDYFGDFGERWISDAAARTAQSAFAKEFLESTGGAIAAKVVDELLGEFVTKPAVGAGANPVVAGILGDSGGSDATEAGSGLGHSAAGETPSSGDPPVYDSGQGGGSTGTRTDDSWWP